MNYELFCEKRTQNEPKRTQMQKSQNEHKCRFNKKLQRKMDNGGLCKTNPNKPKSKPISKAKKSRNEIIFKYFQTFPNISWRIA